MRKHFFQHNWVKEHLEGIDEEDLDEMQRIGILKAHTDMVSKLPEGASLQGSSNRTHNEIWTIGDRVFAMQSSPELNVQYIKDLVIMKLYDIGKLDDTQMNLCLEQLLEEMIPISRHFMLKCIYSFIKTPNNYAIKL